MESTARRPSEILARQVRKWRERRRLSAQGLAERIAEDGGSLSRVAISKIENGDRGVSLDEWLQLAYALAVPPPLLFLDLEDGTDVAIVPGAEVHPWLAWEWATGKEAPVTTARKIKRVDEWNDALAAIRLYSRERQAADAVYGASLAVNAANYTGLADRIRTARAEQVAALQELAAVLDDMTERGVVPPGMPAEWLDLMGKLKMLRHPEAVSTFALDEDQEPNGQR